MEAMLNATSSQWESTSTIFYTYTNNSIIPSCVYGGQMKYEFLVLCSLFIVMAFVGNALVLWVIVVGTKLKSMTDVCLLNLVLADLLLVLFLPFLLYHFNHSWIFGTAMCILVRGSCLVGFYSGIFIIVLMSIDRYLAVVHAVLAMRVRTKTWGTVSCLVIWILAVAVSFPDLLYIGVEEQSTGLHCKPFPSDINLVAIVIFKMNIVGLLVPLIIVGFCYSRILWTLYKSQSSKKHSIRLIVLVMLVFFCCWMPYNAALFVRGLQLMSVTYQDCEAKQKIWLTLRITEALGFSNCFLNPFLYVFVGEKFRRHLVRLIKESWSICC